MRAAGPGTGPAARILKMLISREKGFMAATPPPWGTLGGPWGPMEPHLGGWLGHWRLKGVLEEKVFKTIVFYCTKCHEGSSRLDETRASVTKYCVFTRFVSTGVSARPPAHNPLTL